MLTETQGAINALNALATQFDTFWTDAMFTNLVGGWNSVPLQRSDLSSRVRRLSERLGLLEDKDATADLRRKLLNVPAQVCYFQTQTMPQMASGNLQICMSIFESIIANLEQSIPLPSLPTWEEVRDSGQIPRDLARSLKNLQTRLSLLDPQTAALSGKVAEIEAAHSVAAELPIDYQNLKSMRDELHDLLVSAHERLDDIVEVDSKATTLRVVMEERERATAEVVLKIDSAYSAATSVGLAASFQERANSLQKSTWIWVGFLALALVSGGVIGFYRVGALEKMQTTNVSPAWLTLNAIIAIGSIAAPVWFAWLSTRQISQRFRLSEDYGYKAAVARAYEGYRREAARIDPALEKRLFASALERLEEAPLRFVSVEEHSTPYEALFSNIGFQKLIDKIPTVDKAKMFSSLVRHSGKKEAPELLTAATNVGEVHEGDEGEANE